MGPPTMVGTTPWIDWRLAWEQKEHAAAAGDTHTDADATEGMTTTTMETSGSGKGTGEEASLGASGSSGAEWSGRKIKAYSFRRPEIHGEINVAN